jgi:response regulator of citrate/malate metabolism
VVESRPAMSEPATHSLHHTTTTTTSKTALSSGIGKNMLGLTTQPIIGAPTYIQHTTSTSPHLTSASRSVLLYYLIYIQLFGPNMYIIQYMAVGKGGKNYSMNYFTPAKH